jgi:hypothetical protein
LSAREGARIVVNRFGNSDGFKDVLAWGKISTAEGWSDKELEDWKELEGGMQVTNDSVKIAISI